MRTWRRFHGDDFAAHVLQHDTTSYVVAVWHHASGRVRQLERRFRRLESAKAAADDLVRRTFKHSCSMEQCGTWLVWSA
jgi:hypothetical protein